MKMRSVTVLAVLLGGICGYIVNVSTHSEAQASAPRAPTFVVVPRIVPVPVRVPVPVPTPAVACASVPGTPAAPPSMPTVTARKPYPRVPHTDADILRPRDSKEWTDFRDMARAELGRDADAFIAEHEHLCDEVSQARLAIQGITGTDTSEAQPIMTGMVDAYRKRAEFVKTLPEFADGKNADKLARLSRPWIVACFGQEALDAIEQR